MTTTRKPADLIPAALIAQLKPETVTAIQAFLDTPTDATWEAIAHVSLDRSRDYWDRLTLCRLVRKIDPTFPGGGSRFGADPVEWTRIPEADLIRAALKIAAVR